MQLRMETCSWSIDTRVDARRLTKRDFEIVACRGKMEKRLFVTSGLYVVALGPDCFRALDVASSAGIARRSGTVPGWWEKPHLISRS